MKSNNNGISIECLNKILDEFDYENYLFSKKTTKLEYYTRKFLKHISELISHIIKFLVYYVLAYLIYKAVGNNVNWIVVLLATFYSSKK